MALFSYDGKYVVTDYIVGEGEKLLYASENFKESLKFFNQFLEPVDEDDEEEFDENDNEEFDENDWDELPDFNLED